MRTLVSTSRFFAVLVFAFLLPCSGAGQDPASDWKTALQKAEAAWQAGKNGEAERLFNRALDLAAQPGVPAIRLAETAHRFGQFYLQRGRRKESRDKLSIAQRIVTDELGADTLALASVLDDWARWSFLLPAPQPARWSSQAGPSGDTRYNRGVAFYESRPYQSPPSTVRPEVRGIIGWSPDYRAGLAMCYLKQALAIRENRLGPRHLDVAATLHNIAAMELRLGKPGNAAENLARAVAIQEADPQALGSDLTSTLELYAKALRQLGRKDEARRYEARARRIQRGSTEPR